MTPLRLCSPLASNTCRCISLCAPTCSLIAEIPDLRNSDPIDRARVAGGRSIVREHIVSQVQTCQGPHSQSRPLPIVHAYPKLSVCCAVRTGPYTCQQEWHRNTTSLTAKGAQVPPLLQKSACRQSTSYKHTQRATAERASLLYTRRDEQLQAHANSCQSISRCCSNCCRSHQCWQQQGRNQGPSCHTPHTSPTIGPAGRGQAVQQQHMRTGCC